MPLKERSRALGGAATAAAAAPVTSRERPTAQDLIDKANAIDTSADEDGDAGLDNAPTDITDDGDGDEQATDTTGEADATTPTTEPDGDGATSTAAPTRRGRPPRATTPTTEPGADPKPRMSEIQREVKALRSEYTAAQKQIEAEYGERLKALRSEYDVLNSQVVEQTFTL